jgi:hypothetical protein
VASDTERLPWGVPDGAITFLVAFALLVFFLALVLPAVVVGFLTALSTGAGAVWASKDELVTVRLRLISQPSQDFRQGKLNLKNILRALQSIKTMQIIYLALILKLVFYRFHLNFYSLRLG